jgi:F420-non-reducing hydrogenase iron-sulfur subunit
MIWEPGIVVFCCNASSCAGESQPAAGSLPFPGRVRIVRVPCASRVSEYMIMSALRSGADGILVAGGSEDDCPSAREREGDRRRLVLLVNLLEFIGIEPGRVQISWESALAGDELRVLIGNFTEEMKTLGAASRLVKQLEPVQVVE